MTPAEGRSLSKRIKGVLGRPYYRLDNDLRNAVAQQGKIRTMGRRALRVDKPYIALNRLIQGTAADIMKAGLINAYDAGLNPILCVHDEIVCEIPNDLLAPEDAKSRLEEAMVSAPERFGVDRETMPLKVESVVCMNNYGEAK